jgi:hypothetical protein
MRERQQLPPRPAVPPNLGQRGSRACLLCLQRSSARRRPLPVHPLRPPQLHSGCRRVLDTHVLRLRAQHWCLHTGSTLRPCSSRSRLQLLPPPPLPGLRPASAQRWDLGSIGIQYRPLCRRRTILSLRLLPPQCRRLSEPLPPLRRHWGHPKLLQPPSTLPALSGSAQQPHSRRSSWRSCSGSVWRRQPPLLLPHSPPQAPGPPPLRPPPPLLRPCPPHPGYRLRLRRPLRLLQLSLLRRLHALLRARGSPSVRPQQSDPAPAAALLTELARFHQSLPLLRHLSPPPLPLLQRLSLPPQPPLPLSRPPSLRPRRGSRLCPLLWWQRSRPRPLRLRLRLRQQHPPSPHGLRRCRQPCSRSGRSLCQPRLLRPARRQLLAPLVPAQHRRRSQRPIAAQLVAQRVASLQHPSSPGPLQAPSVPQRLPHGHSPLRSRGTCACSFVRRPTPPSMRSSAGCWQRVPRLQAQTRQVAQTRHVAQGLQHPARQRQARGHGHWKLARRRLLAGPHHPPLASELQLWARQQAAARARGRQQAAARARVS